MSSVPEKFWLEDITDLFRQVTILPNSDMTEEERLNTMTRLVIIISIILLLFGIGSWLLFLVLGVVLVIVLYYANVKSKPPDSPSDEEESSDEVTENYVCNNHLPDVTKERRIKPLYGHSKV